VQAPFLFVSSRKTCFHGVFAAVFARRMNLSSKYPQRAVKIR